MRGADTVLVHPANYPMVLQVGSPERVGPPPSVRFNVARGGPWHRHQQTHVGGHNGPSMPLRSAVPREGPMLACMDQWSNGPTPSPPPSPSPPSPRRSHLPFVHTMIMLLLLLYLPSFPRCPFLTTALSPHPPSLRRTRPRATTTPTTR